MKLKSLAPLLALIPLIAFAAAHAQLSPAATAATSLQSATPQTYSRYSNDQFHFSIIVPSKLTAESSNNQGGVTIQFIDPQGNYQFQVSAWPYQDLDIALGEEGAASTAGDQPSTLAVVHIYRNDLVEITFVKNGISYNVQTLPERATSTLDILKSWEFI
jgi:hypothetical protein